ncbi:hypothetical protein N5D61_17810 [Pseudomonas sp. GD03842]|uniref:hypothetical protein n=1 Tax=Pseudomonas sp. GD03842 TaxID=2975385 RepID=UPI002446FAD9|nr:hypothetical protein [Pseudomonas sp. GD03842]MDH0748180.1 hypothetical protein [Pseudomonas sp. GD03842]
MKADASPALTKQRFFGKGDDHINYRRLKVATEVINGSLSSHYDATEKSLLSAPGMPNS